MNIKSRNITSEFFTIFAVILISLLCLMGSFLYIEERKNTAYEDIIERNAQINAIYTLLNSMDTSLNNIIRTDDITEYISYMHTAEELDRLLFEISNISQDRQIILNYIRRILAFNNYQKALLIKAPENFGISKYENLVFIRRCITDYKKHAQQMLTDDLAITETQYRIIIQRFNNDQLFICLIGALVMLSCGILFYLRSKLIVNSLRTLHNYAQLLAARKWAIEDLPTGHYSELNELSEILNDMKHEIVGYVEHMEEKRQLEIQLYKSRISMLKAQINPHFLFNALNIISKMSFYDPEKIMELVEAISKILRYSLDTQDRLVPLQKELEIVQAYLLIQNNRFSGTFEVKTEIEDSLMELHIPSMVIQPLIENCFKHAFGYQDVLHIVLSAYNSSDGIKLIVEDDGCGFDTSLLEKKETGIGLKNVSERLELEYKQKNLLQVDSVLGKYTKITITIPMEDIS